jgi:hypothetical protein
MLNTIRMAKSTNIVKRKRGRPADVGAGAFVGLRLPPALLKQVDDWAKREAVDGRSQAIRDLIERGLKRH